MDSRRLSSEATPVPTRNEPDPAELEMKMQQLQIQEATLSQQIQEAQELYSRYPAGDPNGEHINIEIQMYLRNLQKVQSDLHTIQQAFPAAAAPPVQVGLVTASVQRSGTRLVDHEVQTNAAADGGLPNIATFRLPERYSDARTIGAGSFGMVIQATDTVTNKVVAIKKILRPWEQVIKSQRTYRELKLLKYLQESWPGGGDPMQHENIVAMLGCWMDTSDLYIAMEHGGSDLATIMKTQKVSTEHVQFFGYQILRAFKFLHSAGIIHRDLKPGNIACNTQCDLKILDFGLARQSSDASGMTGYVATRYYRAPEVILQPTNYGKALDMWSFGCIMAELMLSLEWSMSKRYKMLAIGDPNSAPQPEISKPTVLTTEDRFPVQFDSESCPFRIGQKLTVWGNVEGRGGRELGYARIRAFEQDPATGRVAVTIQTPLASTSNVRDIIVQTANTQNMFAGQDRVQQLEEIARVLGKPSEEYIQRLENDVTRRMHMCGIELGHQISECSCGVTQREHWVRTLPNDLVRRPFRDLKRFELAIPEGMAPDDQQALLDAHLLGIDILEHILVYEPEQRYTAETAIQHPFFEDYHDPDDEPCATHPFDNSCESWNLNAQQWMEACQRECDSFNATHPV